MQQAQAERAGATLTLSNTLQIRDNPQQINAQVDAAQAGVTLAQQNIAVMQTRLAEARYRRDFYDNDKDKRETLDKEIAIAQKNLEAAQAQLNGARVQSVRCKLCDRPRSLSRRRSIKHAMPTA